MNQFLLYETVKKNYGGRLHPSTVTYKLCVWSWWILFWFPDLRTMSERLKTKYYCSKKLFVADMQRIFSNCRAYNAADTEYVRYANTLEKFFMNKIKEYSLIDDDWNIQEFRALEVRGQRSVTIGWDVCLPWSVDLPMRVKRSCLYLKCQNFFSDKLCCVE